MNKYFDPNNPMHYHGMTFIMTALALLLIGAIFLQINSCRVVDYIYSSGRMLDGTSNNFICKIF